MKAIRVHAPGGPEVLSLEDLPIPEAGAGQVVVQVEAAGVNFIDICQRAGQYCVAAPFIPGQEGAGLVTAVGSGVTGVREGDRVAWTGALGSYAQFAAVPADRVVPLPDSLPARLAAAGEVFDLVASGALRLRIVAELPLAEAAEAHRQLEGRLTAGKILVIP